MLYVHDAGLMAYRPAWDLQLAFHERVCAGEYPEGVLILLEHPAVITTGRRADAAGHLLASEAMLKARGVEFVESDRGGDITFHGLGQLVGYPILPLNYYGFNLHSYMRFLEEVVIGTAGEFGVKAIRDPMPEPATGVWVEHGGEVAKICALGVKLRRWVTLHGLALNVTTDLSYFSLINPCGLSRPVTSMGELLGERTPGMGEVKGVMGRVFGELLGERRRDAAR